MLRNAALGIVLLLAICSSAHAKGKKYSLADLEPIGEAVTSYTGCLHRTYFAQAKLFPNKHQIARASYPACQAERLATVKAYETTFGSVRRARIDVSTYEKEFIHKLGIAYDEDVSSRLRTMAITLGIFGNCAMANRPGASLFYDKMIDGLQNDYAYFRRKANMDKAISQYAKIANYAELKKNPEQWCQKVSAEMQAISADMKSLLFVE